MVGIQVSFWDGLFSGVMLVSGRVTVVVSWFLICLINSCNQKALESSAQQMMYLHRSTEVMLECQNYEFKEDVAWTCLTTLVGFKYVLFSSLPVEMIQFDEHIFQMGWNHQLVQLLLFPACLKEDNVLFCRFWCHWSIRRLVLDGRKWKWSSFLCLQNGKWGGALASRFLDIFHIFHGEFCSGPW